MSANEELSGSGGGWTMREKIGVALVSFGLLIFALGAAWFLWFWLGTIIPFFWDAGNYWPAIATLAFLSFIVGMVMVPANQES